MTHTRREFIKAGSAAAALAAAGLGLEASDLLAAPNADRRVIPAAKPLRILVLGGTGFIGPHMVDRAIERGHKVTVFNRGKSNEKLPKGVETLLGDRDGHLDSLKGHQWDAVIDTSGYVPRLVRDSASLLKSQAQQYLFISSVSAYAGFEKPGQTEDAPGGTIADTKTEKVTGESYGPLKILCEKAVLEEFPKGTTVVRPGYIVGPGDSTDRWTYWPLRVAAGGEMIAPGKPTDPIEIIDARDLAAFVVHLLEQRTLGTFNGVGPSKPLTMGGMLDRLNAGTGGKAKFTWVDAPWLESQKANFPIWNPQTGPFAQLHTVSNARSVAAGLTYRTLEDTSRDTLKWWNSLDQDRRDKMRSGLRQQPDLATPTASLAQQMDEEKKLLAAWKAK